MIHNIRLFFHKLRQLSLMSNNTMNHLVSCPLFQPSEECVWPEHTSVMEFPMSACVSVTHYLWPHSSSLSLDIFSIVCKAGSGLTMRCELILCYEWDLLCFPFFYTHRGETSLWNHVAGPPFPHLDVCCTSCHSIHPVSLHVCRWCRTPVSFRLSRSFTLDHNIFYVGACQGTSRMCLWSAAVTIAPHFWMLMLPQVVWANVTDCKQIGGINQAGFMCKLVK